MRLYLVRHAEAIPLGEAGVERDEKRPLTELGNQQAQRLAEAMHRLRTDVELILTSPLLRARETAEYLRAVWNLSTEAVVVLEDLAPGGRTKKIIRFLNGLSERSVVFVGHMPDLSDWCGWLIGSKRAQIDFAKAGAAYLRYEGLVRKGCATLKWLITPPWFLPPSTAEERQVPASA